MNNKQIFFSVTLMLCNTSFAQEIIIEDPSNYTGSNIIAEGPSNNKIIISIQKDDTFTLNGDVYGAKYTSDNVEKNMVEIQNTIIKKMYTVLIQGGMMLYKIRLVLKIVNLYRIGRR